MKWKGRVEGKAQEEKKAQQTSVTAKTEKAM
jgi:hypothetical protein